MNRLQGTEIVYPTSRLGILVPIHNWFSVLSADTFSKPTTNVALKLKTQGDPPQKLSHFEFPFQTFIFRLLVNCQSSRSS